MKKKPSKKAKRVAKPTWVAVSGGFDPIHVGHIEMMKRARRKGEKLVVILNNDNWLVDKKGFAFMPQRERKMLLEEFPFVDRVVLTDHRPNDPDRSVVRTLRAIRPDFFGNGGDRGTRNTPEMDACAELNIGMRFNLGKKIQSSSWMIENAVQAALRASATKSRKR